MGNPKKAFPSNPFEFSPIKDREKLAGRRTELNKISTYLDGTVSGGCPHIGIFGERGIGKTSLLFATEDLAKEKKLLCLRIMLDQDKASSPGHFWHEIYSELIERATKAGCWGGANSETYLSLISLMTGNPEVNPEHVVLKFPYLLAQHNGDKANITCPGAILKGDILETLEELNKKGIKGIVLQIDEADCLGPNQSILQQLRNLFQEKDLHSTTMMLAGTPAIFKQVEEIFSPMPRQFHPVEVKTFTSHYDTRSLIIEHLPDDIEICTALMPSQNETIEIHALTNGDPQEIQIYCHHMYDAVASDAAKTMELSPKVLKAVMQEFRNNTVGNEETKDIIQAIDELADPLPWFLLKKHLTIEECWIYSCLLLSLEAKKGKIKLPDEKKRNLTKEKMEDAARKLHNSGLLVDPQRTEICGGPIAYAYFKASFNKRSTSVKDVFDGSQNFFITLVHRIVSKMVDDLVSKLAPYIFSLKPRQMDLTSDSYGGLISKLRSGSLTKKHVGNFGPPPGLLFDANVTGRRLKTTKCVEMRLCFSMGQPSLECPVYFLTDAKSDVIKKQIDTWIAKYNKALLDFLGMAIEQHYVATWELPNDIELWRLRHMFGHGMPHKEMEEHFGKSLSSRAIQKFLDNDHDGAAKLFRMIISDSDYDGGSEARNNLGYILLNQGKHEEAIEHLEKSLDIEYSHIAQHNFALSKALTGYKKDSIEQFEELWINIESDSDGHDYSSSTMKILIGDLKKATDVVGLPIDAATIMNLCVLGIKTREDTEAYLKEKYPDDYEAWLT